MASSKAKRKKLISAASIAKFRREVRRYVGRRKNLPWRRTKNPYRILISEVMLQQTPVNRVIPFYRRFIKRFPNLETLARASLRDILGAWKGLGYNRRAVGLKKLSEKVAAEFKGSLPRDPRQLTDLPVIGSGTAGAIAVFAFSTPWPFIETNIRRAFIHFFFPRRRKMKDSEILPLVNRTMDRKRPREWFWALMDYGAALGKRKENPNRRSAVYRRQPPFSGSHRELRGRILFLLLEKRKLSFREIMKNCRAPAKNAKRAIQELEKEGFLSRRGVIITIKRR